MSPAEGSAPQQLPLHSEVPIELTWDLTAIYPSDEAWEADFARASRRLIPQLAQYQGRLRRSGGIMLQALEAFAQCGQLVELLYQYAHLHYDEDTSNQHYKAMGNRAETLFAMFGEATAFMVPELLEVKPARLAQFIAKTEGLQLYQHYFDTMEQERPHVRSHEVEQLLATLSKPGSASGNIYKTFTQTDLKLPQIRDEQGNLVQLSPGLFQLFRDSPDRNVRKAAFEAMFGEAYANWRNTLAQTYQSRVEMNVFYARARNYTSAREMSLSADNLPLSVYDSLIECVHANLPLLQRHMDLRKRILGLDTLQVCDLYVPLVPEASNNVSYQDATAQVLSSVKVFGAEYVSTMQQGFKSRWLDVMETQNKATGAYSSGCWGTHPYILLNWNGSFDDMFTLAHEFGHSMHSYYSRSRQPYAYCDYTIFCAEVASTTNEQLLAQHLLSNTNDPVLKRQVLDRLLEGIRTTLIRQTLFAEFEQQAHALAEADVPLTSDKLCETFYNLYVLYYGKSVELEEFIKHEWSYIPHFYNSFYVFKYATGLSAATALASQIAAEGQPAVNRYLKFLSSGSSDYSINLLKAAGADLSTPQPVQAAFDAYKDYLDQFEALL